MVCTDCGDQGAECLTAERVRVCTSCLYERAARERDALREEVARCHDSLREADRMLRQAYAERDEARAEVQRLAPVVAAARWVADEYHWADSPAGKCLREALREAGCDALEAK